MSLKIKYLGIDFGSSKTTLAGITVDGRLVILGNPKTTAESFATVMGKTESGKYKFFESAYDSDVFKFYNAIKEDIYNGIDNNDAKHKAKLYFEKIFDTVGSAGGSKDPDFSALECVCFGYPKYYQPSIVERYRDTFRKVVGEICEEKFGAKDVRIVSYNEPVLAAFAFGYCNANTKECKDRLKNGDIVLVLDFGGHTMDMVLLQAKSEAGEMRLLPYRHALSEETGIVEMGKSITRSIFDCIYWKELYNGISLNIPKNIDDAKCDLFSGKVTGNGGTEPKRCKYDPIGGDFKHFSLHYDYEGKAIDDNGVLHISMDKGNQSIELGRTIKSACEHIKRYLVSNETALPEHSVSHVLFTGGTSNIKQLRNEAKNAILGAGRWKNNDAESEFLMDRRLRGTLVLDKNNYSDDEWVISSKNAVAIGAALAAKAPDKYKEAEIIKLDDGDAKKLKKDIAKLKAEKDRIAQENAVLKSRLIITQSDKENLKTGLRDIVNVAMDNIKSDDAKRNIKDKRDDLMKKYK